MAESKPSPLQSILDTLKKHNYWDRDFTITFTVRVKPGTEQSMIDQIQKILPLTHKEEGCITFEFSQELADSTHFVLYEHWKNGPSLEFHFGQTYTQEFGGLLAQIATSTESRIFAPIQTLLCQLDLPLQVRASTLVGISTFTSSQMSQITSSSRPPGVIASAGDLNGDGNEDIIIGIYQIVTVYVIFGTANGIPDITDLSSISSFASPSYGIKITSTGSNFGSSISGLGDFNGDGVDDIIIGDSVGNIAYVIFGSIVGLQDLSVTPMNNPQGVILHLPGGGFSFGFAVSSAGDINDDGKDDIMVSAVLASGSFSSSGMVYVVYGSDTLSDIDLSVSLSISGLGFTISGDAAYEYFGSDLSKAGDLNHDGIADIAIGAMMASCSGPNCGMITIIYGKTGTISDIETSTLPSHQGVKILGTTQISIGGPYTMNAAGDLNDDGIDDFAFGAQYSSVNGVTDAGTTFVLYGQTGGFSSNIDLSMPSFPGFKIFGRQLSGYFGSSITSADLNGDGQSDLIVSAPPISNGGSNGVGIVYVFFGENIVSTGGVQLTDSDSLNPQVLQIVGANAGDTFGGKINSAKDFNNDGVNDFLAISHSNVYAIYGTKCDSKAQCSTSLPPICYASKGCVCGESSQYFYQNQCLSQCPQGYFSNNYVCEPCPDSCLICKDASSCETCQEGFTLSGTSCKSACPEGYYYVDSTCQSEDVSGLSSAETIGSVTDTTGKSSSASLAVASVASPTDPGSVTASMLAKMLQYIKYINLPYSQRLEVTFKYNDSIDGPFGVGPKMPAEAILKMPFHSIPARFIKYHLYSSFLLDFWDSLIFLTIITGVLLLVVIVEWNIAKIKQKLSPTVKMIRYAMQNFCLMQFYNVYGDVLLFVALDWRQIDLTNTEAIISFCLSILFLIIGCMILIFHIYILVRFSNLRKNKEWRSQIKEFSQQYHGSTVLFQHFKDHVFTSQSFLLLYVTRNCLFSLVLALLSTCPLVQAILILFMTLFMFAYLILVRPFKDIVNLFQHIACESIVLLVNACVFTIAQLDFTKEGSYKVRDQVCEVIIYASLVFSFVPQVFLLVKIIIAGIAWYKTSRKKAKLSRLNSKRGIVISTQNKALTKKKLQYTIHQRTRLNESAVDATMLQNTSSTSLHVNDSSIIQIPDQEDVERIERGFLVDNSPQRHQLREENQQQGDRQSGSLSKVQEAKNSLKREHRQPDIAQNGEREVSVFRRRSKNSRRFMS